ncbi:MAG: acyl carrier protein [Bdellovibrionota bacterium]
MNVRNRMTAVFCRIFNIDLILTDEMTARDVPEWDSLAHIGLIIEIEDEFGLKFTVDDISDLKNVGEMIELVDRKLIKT